MSLFSDVPANACQGYLTLRAAANERSQAARSHCEDLWQDYRDLADKNFLTQFPAHLHERWFEMYLSVALLRAGYAVECPKPGPDILLTFNGCRIWIEATCASAGEHGLLDSVAAPLVSAPNESPAVTDRPTREMTLRIRNSLDTKEKQIRKYIECGIVAPADVVAIAIDIAGIPNAWADLQDLMHRTLYGLGDLQLKLDPAKNALADAGYTHEPSTTKAKTGSPVNLQSFADGSLPHISAVLGSWMQLGNLSSHRLGDDLALFPNITAGVSWPVGTIRLGQEWAAESGNQRLRKISYIP
jgi:hypothetical protein